MIRGECPGLPSAYSRLRSLSLALCQTLNNLIFFLRTHRAIPEGFGGPDTDDRLWLMVSRSQWQNKAVDEIRPRFVQQESFACDVMTTPPIITPGDIQQTAAIAQSQFHQATT